jgi:hypothetical protein
MDNIGLWATIWLVCGGATVVAAVLAKRSDGWLRLGRIATGVLFTLGGALVHVLNLVNDAEYADFADPAHFAWVTEAWRAVVPPNQLVLIGLLAAFEATVGVLALGGGRRTQLGYAGVLAFYSVLWLFGWFETIWVLVMIPALLTLLLAERRNQTAVASAAVAKERTRVGAGV